MDIFLLVIVISASPQSMSVESLTEKFELAKFVMILPVPNGGTEFVIDFDAREAGNKSGVER